MEPRKFLVLEGVLAENGQFEALGGYETTAAPRPEPPARSAPDAVLKLLDANGGLLTRAPVIVRFPLGCGSEGQVGLAFVRATIPHHPDANTVELVVDEQVVAQLPIGREPPQMTELSVKVGGNGRSLHAKWTHDRDAGADIRLAFVIGKREFPVEATLQQNGAHIDLEPRWGRLEAALRVTISSAFRTTSAITEAFTLPTAQVCGRILAPGPGDEWSAGQPRSLMGNLFDDTGAPVPWDEQRVSWVLDGTRIADARPIAYAGEPASGTHRLALVFDDPERGELELDHVEFTVRQVTDSETRWRTAVDRYLAFGRT
jgi:hypothetical protein